MRRNAVGGKGKHVGGVFGALEQRSGKSFATGQRKKENGLQRHLRPVSAEVLLQPPNRRRASIAPSGASRPSEKPIVAAGSPASLLVSRSVFNGDSAAIVVMGRLFRAYFAGLRLSVTHVIARVAAGNPTVVIASSAT